MAIKFQDSLEVKGGSASKIYLEGAGGTGSSTILQAYNPDDGAGHAGGTAYLKSSGWGEAQLAVGSYRWTQAGGKMTVTGGVYYFNTGNVGIGVASPTYKLDVAGNTRIVGVTDIVHSNTSTGLSVMTNSAVPTTPQVKIGRDSGQWYGVLVDDGNARLIHRQDESGAGYHTITNEIWTHKDDGGVWTWRLRDRDGVFREDYMTLNSSSLTVAGTINVENTSTNLSQANTAGVLRITTSHGWTNIGPANGSWSHFDTDRAQFYFNKPTEFNGTVKPYQNNSYSLGSSSKQWNNIYGRYIYQNGTQVLATRAEVHTRLYSTGGNADDYTEFGIYRNYAEGGPIPSHNTILNVMQFDGRYGFQLGANTVQDVDGLFYRSKDANIGTTWYQVASRDWVQAQGYLTSETDSQTLSFNDQSGELTISNGNTVDLDNRYFDATGRKKWYNINAASAQAKRYRIARVYYCPQHWDDTWQNIEFELLEEGYNASYVKYSLIGFYNGSTSQTLNLKVTDFRGLGTDTQRYNMFLGDHIDAGWEHSGRPVFYTDIFVDVSYYKGLKITADTFGHTYQNTDPTSGAAITVFYDNPDVVDIDYTNVAKTNTYVGDDAMIWNTGNFSQTNVNNWNTAYGWGDHASAGYADASHTHSAADITSGTLDGARLPWQTNDNFGGTYPIVWKATGSLQPFTSSWLNVNGTTDTLHARNIHADGKITSTGPITVNNRTAISVAHWSHSNNSTGAIKIKLPGLHSASNWSMVVLRITTYEYNSNEHTIYYVSGHDWVSGWYNKKVTIIGESDKPVSVTYSESANEDYVIIGDPTSTWSYGHVTVDVMAHPSFYSSAMDISTGWTIEQIEDLGDIELRPVETKRVANEQWVIDQGYITDITTQTDPKYLRSDTSDTMSGNLLVASQTQTDSTTKAEMLTNAVAKFKPHALNSGSLAIAQVDGGNAVGMQFTNGGGTADWDISLQPFGGRVGIGTTTPAALLDVDGTAQMSSGITENTHYVGVSVQHWGDGGTGMYFNTDSVDIRTNAVTRIEFNNSGVSIPSDVYFTGNSRKIYLTGGDTNSQNGWIVGEQDRYGFGATWDSGLSILFQGWDGRNVTDTHNKDLGSVNIRDRVWNFLGSARLNNNDLATQAWVEEQPPAPAAASCAVVGDTIEVSFDPAPEAPDYYQVWASQNGGSYSLIAQIPTQDFSPFMTVIDTSFSVSGLRAYRVYAVRRGIYSDPATTSRTYTQAALEPVAMDVVPMEEAFFVQWDAPASRFVDHYEVYLDTHADQGSLNRNNASLIYSGNNTFYMHRASTNEFHQFWVEIVES